MSQLQDKIEQMKARLDTAGLIQLLDSPQKEVQPVAAQALVDLGSAAVIPLLSLLYDPRPLMQSLAIILLGQIGDTRATEPLVEIWKTKPSRECARALGRIKGPGAYEALVEKLDLGDETLTAWVVSGLELLEEPRSIEPLVRVLQSEMEVTSEKAAGLLIKLGWTPDPKKAEPLHGAQPGNQQHHLHHPLSQRDRRAGERAGENCPVDSNLRHHSPCPADLRS
jgi:HEAT repeat protein